jgi:hypothetical protein
MSYSTARTFKISYVRGVRLELLFAERLELSIGLIRLVRPRTSAKSPMSRFSMISWSIALREESSEVVEPSCKMLKAASRWS